MPSRKLLVPMYCTISFNSAVTRHGAPKNAEISVTSRQIPKPFGRNGQKIPIFGRLRRQTDEIFGLSRRALVGAEIKISAGRSRVAGPAELNEMVQYTISCIP